MCGRVVTKGFGCERLCESAFSYVDAKTERVKVEFRSGSVDQLV